MLCHRGMLQRNLCPRCNPDVETTLHCLRDCEFDTRFWKSIGFLDTLFFQWDSLCDWIRHDINDGSIFLVAYWWLWCARNKLCITNEVVSSYTLKLITLNYVNFLTKYFLEHNISHPTRTITWSAHKGSNMILKVDDNSLGIPGVSGFGGLLKMLMVLGFTILRIILVVPTSFMLS